MQRRRVPPSPTPQPAADRHRGVGNLDGADDHHRLASTDQYPSTDEHAAADEHPAAHDVHDPAAGRRRHSGVLRRGRGRADDVQPGSGDRLRQLHAGRDRRRGGREQRGDRCRCSTRLRRPPRPAIAADVETVVTAIRSSLESGEDLTSDAVYHAADEAVDVFVADSCGYDTVAVSAVEYTFASLPTSLPAGRTTFAFTNNGAEIHEMVVFRINDERHRDHRRAAGAPRGRGARQGPVHRFDVRRPGRDRHRDARADARQVRGVVLRPRRHHRGRDGRRQRRTARVPRTSPRACRPRSPSPDVTVGRVTPLRHGGHHGEDQGRSRVQRVRNPAPEVGRSVLGLRRVEHARRGGRGAVRDHER